MVQSLKVAKTIEELTDVLTVLESIELTTRTQELTEYEAARLTSKTMRAIGTAQHSLARLSHHAGREHQNHNETRNAKIDAVLGGSN